VTGSLVPDKDTGVDEIATVVLSWQDGKPPAGDWPREVRGEAESSDWGGDFEYSCADGWE